MNQTSKVVELVTTEVFDQTLELTLAHLSDNNNNDIVAAIEKVETELDNFEAHVLRNPEIYAVCPELLDLGVSDFRHYTRNGIRILYTVTEEQDRIVVSASAMLGTKQSITNQLIDLCVFRH